MPDTPSPSTPTGHPDRRDRDAWLLLALIGDDDVEAAQRHWRDHAPQAFAGAPLGRDGWRWDDQKQIYVAANRHKLDQDHLKRLALLFALAAAADLRQLGSDVASGKTPIDQWQNDVADLAKRTAVTQGALAAGGFDRLTPDVRQIITGEPGKAPGLAFSMDRLRGFADDIEQQQPRADTVPAIVDRSAMYAAVSNGTMEAVKRASHQDAKDAQGRLLYLFERNVLGDAQHCHNTDDAEGCTEVSEMGWQPIGSLPLPGLRACGPMCACSMQFSLTGPATDETISKSYYAPIIRKSEDDDGDGHWVTINGVHVFISDSTGRIVRGPSSMVGKKPSEIGRPVHHHESTNPKKPPKDNGGKRTVEEKPTARTKSEIAKQSATYVGKDIQRYAEEHNEPQFAKAVGGLSYDDNEPVDVVAGKSGKVEHGVELKTMVGNKASKLTMDRYAQVRKVEWEREKNATFHTVVIDDREVYPGGDESKRSYYYRRGVAGSARVNSMYRAKNVGEIKRLMNMPESELPEGAGRTDSEVRNGKWKFFTDKQGRGYKNSKTGEIVRPKK